MRKKNGIRTRSIDEARASGLDSETHIDPKAWLVLDDVLDQRVDKNTRRLFKEDNLDELFGSMLSLFFDELSNKRPDLLEELMSRGVELTSMRVLNKKNSKEEEKQNATKDIKRLIISMMLSKHGYDKDNPKKLRRFLLERRLLTDSSATPDVDVEEFKDQLTNYIFSGEVSHYQAMVEPLVENKEPTRFEHYYENVCRLMNIDESEVNKHGKLKQVLSGHFDDYLKRKKNNPEAPIITTNLINTIYQDKVWVTLFQTNKDELIKSLKGDVHHNRKTTKIDQVKFLVKKIFDEPDIRELENIVMMIKSLSEEEKSMIRLDEKNNKILMSIMREQDEPRNK